MTFPVKWYASNMQGAPSLGDTTAGALTALLKAVLVTGFGTLTLTSLVWDATEGAAKATIAGGHAYLKDSVIEVSGASPAAYNGEHRVKKVSSTEVWFELDAGNPGMAGSGATMTMKVAPLGWTLTHESGDGMVAIYRPTNVSESGNVSLRIDNTAFSGWTGASNAYLAKVLVVEDVVDINTFTTVVEGRWPATGRYSDKRWDLIGDPQLFYFMPTYAAANYQFMYHFGYIKSLRPGDRYHATFNSYPSLLATETTRNWSLGAGSANTSYGNTWPLFDSVDSYLARPFHQLFGTTTIWRKGLFGRFGTGMNVPNGPDNGFYLSVDPVMVMETNSHMRGYLPGLICPFASPLDWHRKNFAGLPALPAKIVRFILLGYAATQNPATQICMVGFDLTGPWR